MKPPRVPLRLLEWFLPREDRDEIIGDLNEQFGVQVAARGRRQASRWYWGQTLLLVRPWTIRAIRQGVRSGSVRTDLRYAIRSLVHARWFTIGAALTFALGIGVNLAVFSAVDQILFRHLPYSHVEEVVVLRQCGQGPDDCGTSFPDDVAQAAKGLSTLGPLAFATWTISYSLTPTPGEVPPLMLYSVSANVLRVLGVRPILGRDFEDEDARLKRGVALVSYETWQQRFGGQPTVLGTRIGRTQSVAIVGVLPRGFIPPSWMMTDPAWNGLALVPSIMVMAPIARLQPGATLEQARAEVAALVTSLPPPARSNSTSVARARQIRVDPLDGQLFSRYQNAAWLVVAAAAVVLLIACANLAGLLLARGRSREHEAAIRTALGASAGRIVLGAIVETSVVCLAGASVAWIVLAWTSQAIAALLPAVFGRYLSSVTDLRVVGAALAASAVCAIVAGAWPGARMARVPVAVVLQRAGGPGRRTRLPGGRALLFAEASLGTVLVLGAALAIRSFDVMATENIGYQPNDLYRVTMSLDSSVTPARSLADFKQALEVSAELPNVIGVAGADSIMTNGAAPMRGFSKDRSLRGARYEVTAGFFGAIGGSVLAGREFTADEVESHAPVAMLSPAGVALVWPGVSPTEAVGRTLTLAGEVPRQVVGIAPQVQHSAYGGREEPALYVPLGSEPSSYAQWIVRMTPGTLPPTARLRQALGERLGARTIGVASVADALSPSLRDPRFRAVLLGTLAACALLLVAAGVYAIASFEVSLRRYEVGVRMTLGASAGQIRRVLMLDALKPVVAGLIAGGIVNAWAATWFQSFLYKVNGRDVRVFGVVATVLILTTLVAAWRPARRAASTDPALVLRAQ